MEESGFNRARGLWYTAPLDRTRGGAEPGPLESGPMCSATRKSRLARAGRLLTAVIAACALGGCLGARGDIEAVEAQLRQQQDRADQYVRELSQVRQELDVARQEADLLRRQMADSGGQALPAEFTESLFRVQRLQFNSLMSGGRDRDGQPGDDVLVAVLTPVDEHGDLVKLPGSIELEALDLTRPEGERQVGKWTFDAAQSRELWKSGLFSAGYQVEVPWQRPPSEELLLLAKLTTADGRQFDATQPVKVELAQSDSPRPIATPAAARPLTERRDAGPWGAEPPPGAAGRAGVQTAGLEQVLDMSNDRPPRPETEPVHFEEAAATPQPSADAFTSARKPAVDPEVATQQPEQPRPFPEGLQTSDVWTDETIPFRR